MNAAVEAARAGETGLGLAVVAEVVRSVTGSAAEVRSLVDQVNRGSHEQARGIEEISSAILQAEQITQSAAAHAEEGAAASEEMSAQAQTLHSIVQQLEVLVGAG